MTTSSPLTVGVPKETFPGERRVAVVPASVPNLRKAGLRVVVEQDAGNEAGFADDDYTAREAEVLPDRAAVFAAADIVLQVRAGGANPEAGKADEPLLRAGQLLIAMCNPLGQPEMMQKLAEKKLTVIALELLPRITRAQSMDVLSSMATVAGYKAVLLAANAAPRMFPMLMTAAGTITPARVFVVGAGVAGLQAIATARRLGAVVQAYDIRPVVKEQVESLGARFVELDLETEAAEEKGGYARKMDEEFYRKQREKMTEVVAANDVVLTTAAVPGKKAPVLITREMIAGMKRGSVIVDLAAEWGGNCELTQPGQTVVEGGVTILGPCNLPSTIPLHASEMYSRNITTMLLSLVKEGKPELDVADEIVSGTLICRDGEIVHPQVRKLLGLAVPEEPAEETESEQPAESSTESSTEAPAESTTDAQTAGENTDADEKPEKKAGATGSGESHKAESNEESSS